MNTTAAPVPINLIGQLMWAHTATSALAASIELEVYSAIQAGNYTTKKVEFGGQYTQLKIREVNYVLSPKLAFLARSINPDRSSTLHAA